MTQRITLIFPWPNKALHSNSRAHWAEKARKVKQARTDAFYVAKEAKLPTWPDATILVEGWPPTRRGDPHNLPIACKAIIDGIADAMGCDDKAFRVDWPQVWAGTRKGGQVVMHIMPGMTQ